MKKPVNIKKIILPNLPYLLFALLGTKCGQAARLAPGLDFSQKALHILDGFRLAFKSLLPSFHPADLLVGLLIAAALRRKKQRNFATMQSTARPAGVHNFKCK